MNRILTVSFIALICFNLAFAQKRSTVLGDMWTGEVSATNDSTREITIKFDEKGKTEAFTGILAEGYTLKMKDGSSHELKVSEIPVGARVRVFAKSKEHEMGGKKVKVKEIFRIDFLGKDEYSKLREALNLESSVPVTSNESESLPAINPVKIFLAIEDSQIKDSFVSWLSQWNKEQASKYGSLEIVSDLGQADVSLVVYKGADNLLVQPFMIGADDKVHTFPPVTAFLAVQKNNALEVLWKQVLLTNPEKSGASKGLIEKEIEKRMKARSQSPKK